MHPPWASMWNSTKSSTIWYPFCRLSPPANCPTHTQNTPGSTAFPRSKLCWLWARKSCSSPVLFRDTPAPVIRTPRFLGFIRTAARRIILKFSRTRLPSAWTIRFSSKSTNPLWPRPCKNPPKSRSGSSKSSSWTPQSAKSSLAHTVPAVDSPRPTCTTHHKPQSTNWSFDGWYGAQTGQWNLLTAGKCYQGNSLKK